ncbi:MAG: hypothetical protein WD051_11030 [Steroidobacteraceae bacterium]
MTWRVRVRPEAELDLLVADLFDGVRRVFARRFPFAVSFQIVGDEVVVISILHMRRQRMP